ncbi:MAG: MFS transporter [Anaerolineae bacterium]|nr:MFS transporter [Anaerolineae bacterium]
MSHHRPESAPPPATWRFAPFAELSRDNRLIALSMFLWGASEGLWFYVYPLYIESLGADPKEIGLVISVAMMGMAATFIPAGLLADRYSRKKIMLAGYLLGLFSMILVAVAPDWRALLPGFLLYYMSAFIIPAENSYIANACEGQDLNRAFTMMTAAYSAGIIFSPALGGWLGERAGMRNVFLLAASLIVLSTLAILPLKEQPTSYQSAALGIKPLLRNRSFWGLSLVVAFIYLVIYLGWPLTPNFLQEVRGLDLSLIGTLATAQSLGAFFLAIFLGRVSWGLWGLVASGLLIWASYGLLLLFPFPFAIACAYFLRGSFSALASLSSAEVGKILESPSMGLGFGLFSTLRTLALVPGPYIAGYLYAFRPDLPFLASIASIPAAILLTTMILRRSL